MISRRAFTTLLLGAACDRAASPLRPQPRRARPTRPAIGSAPPDDDLALFRRHPALRGLLPRATLGSFPTPVEHAAELCARLGLRSLFVKRDDVSAEPYGGGKVRKLELYFGDALRKGRTSVATFGGVGSNHALATAIYARRLGLRATLFLLPEPPSEHARRQVALCAAFGADVRLGPVRSEADPAFRRFLDGLPDRGAGLYAIPPGGSSPLGNAAFVNAAFELALQVERGDLPPPDVVYVAMGTMGTVVGLAIGLAAAGLPTRVAAVRASSPGTSSESKLLAMASETAAFLRAHDPSFPAADVSDRIRIVADQLGAGYARPTSAGDTAIDLARRHAGLSLEPTYTAKALAALVADASTLRDQVVLFWNTHDGHRLAGPG